MSDVSDRDSTEDIVGVKLAVTKISDKPYRSDSSYFW